MNKVCKEPIKMYASYLPPPIVHSFHSMPNIFMELKVSIKPKYPYITYPNIAYVMIFFFLSIRNKQVTVGS